MDNAIKVGKVSSLEKELYLIFFDPFLDCLVSCNKNKQRTAIYRKPTHTDRLLDQSSLQPYFSQSYNHTNFV